MKTIFVINEQTGKVIGTMKVDKDTEEVVYHEIEEAEGGVIATTITFKIQLIPIEHCCACVIVIPDQEIAETLTTAEVIQYIN